jgi:hypothetical protein
MPLFPRWIQLLSLMVYVQWVCILWSITRDEHDFKVGQYQGTLVDGHNDLSLDGCEGDSGRGAN